jgi:hypothetical protein
MLSDSIITDTAQYILVKHTSREEPPTSSFELRWLLSEVPEVSLDVTMTSLFNIFSPAAGNKLSR